MSIVAGGLKTRLKTPVLTVWETLTMLWPLRPPVPLGNIPRNYPTCPLPWGSLSQLPSRYFHRPTEMDAKLRASRERPHDSAGGEGIRRHRMRFSVTSRHPGSVEQPPASLRGTMGNGSTGQMRSSNPPPGCGAACARVRKSRFGVWPHGKAHFATPPRGAIT